MFFFIWHVGWAAQGCFGGVLEDGESILEVSKKCSRNHPYPSTHVSVSCVGLPAAVLEEGGGAINSGLALSPPSPWDSWHSSFCESFLENWMKPLQLALDWGIIHRPSSSVFSRYLGWMVPWARCGFFVNIFYCLSLIFCVNSCTLHWCVFFTLQCYSMYRRRMRWKSLSKTELVMVYVLLPSAFYCRNVASRFYSSCFSDSDPGDEHT